jgi:opacity protein-like surface antigen
MKKFLGLAVVFVALALIPTTAFAKDKTGGFGVGYDNSLGGVGGVSVRYQVAKNFGIQAILGFEQQSFEQKDDNGETTNSISNRVLQASLRGDVGIAFTKKTNLSVIFGLDIFNASYTDDPTADGADEIDESTTRFAFEVGLKAEYFFTNYFSVHGDVGLAFALINNVNETRIGPVDPRSAVGAADASGFVLNFGQGDVFGAFGFTFWFN